jgi:hypothetical protein
MENRYVIPKVTPAQIALIGSRSAGVIANQIAFESRKNATHHNPYTDGIDPLSSRDASLNTPSALGTPIWDRVTFKAVNYTLADGTQRTSPEMTFESILISVSFPRNIVKTEIIGKNGTVKEYIGEGDAQISFRGVITGKNGHYPLEEVGILKDIIKAPIAIPVVCKYLQNLDIDTIVFEDRFFEQEEGSYSYQTFSMNAISDTPIEVKTTAI